MIPSVPFTYRELEGTSWYRRFLSAEYTIRLNNEKERHIIQDAEMKPGADPERSARYREALSRYFLDEPGLSEGDPWSILLDLRRLKSRILRPEDLSPRKAVAPPFRRGKEKTFPQDLPSDSLFLRPAGREKTILFPGAVSALEEARELLLLPGDPETLARDIAVFLLSHKEKKRITLALFPDSLYRGCTRTDFVEACRLLGVEPSRFTIVDDIHYPLKEETTTALDRFTRRGGLVIARGPWAYFACFRRLDRFLFSVDNREWALRPLLGTPYLEGSELDADGPEYPERDGRRPNSEDHHPFLREFIGIQEGNFPIQPLSGMNYTPLTLEDFIEHRKTRDFSSQTGKNRLFLKDFSGEKNFQGVMDALTLDGSTVPVEPGTPKSTLITGFFAPAGAVRFAPSLGIRRTTPKEAPGAPQRGFSASFTYYFTANLAESYNARVPERERIPWHNLLIDSYYLAGKEPRETPPLYGKGFIGGRRDGSLFIGHLTPAGYTLKWGRHRFRFSGERVNPNIPGPDPVLYRPGHGETHVGEGRFCLVLVQDRLVYQGRGPCRIPPIGMVIVSDTPLPPVQGAVNWEIDYREFTAGEKGDFLWLCGGFNLLVSKGKNLYPTVAEGRRAMEREGWFQPQSALTQETQLLPEVRQPRTIVGMTNRNRTGMLVFSGRTALSAGATFGETVAAANALLPPGEVLTEAINLDGGASAALTALKDGEERLLSHPCPSAENPAGIIRPLPAYLTAHFV